MHQFPQLQNGKRGLVFNYIYSDLFKGVCVHAVQKGPSLDGFGSVQHPEPRIGTPSCQALPRAKVTRITVPLCQEFSHTQGEY